MGNGCRKSFYVFFNMPLIERDCQPQSEICRQLLESDVVETKLRIFDVELCYVGDFNTLVNWLDKSQSNCGNKHPKVLGMSQDVVLFC